MKFATFNTVARNKSPMRRKVENERCWWVQFGDDVLLYGANNKFDAALSKLPKTLRLTEQKTGSIQKGNMHLVVQKGRTFQLENPKVPVILDKGRYLVVDLSKAKASKLSKRQEPCYHIEPLQENTKAFESIARKANTRAPSRQEAELVARLQNSDFQNYLNTLVAFPTRYSTSTHYAEAAAWASELLTSLGFLTTIVPVAVPGSGQSSNVVARKAGSGSDARNNLIIGAHLDSVNHPGGVSAIAPGADDNASGAAGLLSLATALAGHQLKHDVTFVLFGGEEQGLHGSTQYLASLTASEKQAIMGMLNMDMIGSVNTSPQSVLLEGAALSQAMIDSLIASSTAHTSLTMQVSLNPFASDHVPFINAGIPAVLTIEGADSANHTIHTAEDTVDRIDIAYACEILRMNLGFVAAQVEIIEQPSLDCGCSDNDIDATNTDQLRILSGHYQGLFAQYSRLHRDGLINADDYQNWQQAQSNHDEITNGLQAMRR